MTPRGRSTHPAGVPVYSHRLTVQEPADLADELGQPGRGTFTWPYYRPR